MNELVRKPNWFKRNWKWLVPIILLVILFILSLPKGTANVVLHYAKGYSNSEVPANALEIVKKNERVMEVLGELEPIGKLTILEGYVKYSKNADSVFMAVTIRGSKGKGMMDVKAYNRNGEWHNYELGVRIKDPQLKKEAIPIALP